MPVIELSRTVSTKPARLWQVLADFDAWPTVFDEMSRCKVLQSAPPNIELQCTDDKGRVWHETCEIWEPEKQLSMRVQADDNHPFRKLSRTWNLDAVADSTTITLHCEYAHRMPMLGKWLDRLFYKNDFPSLCESALDNIVHRAREQKWTYRETVQTILNRKGNNIVAARPEDSVSSLCAVMKEYGIGTILIRDASEKLVGLVSERDVVYQIAEHGTALLNMSAEHIMTRELIVCEPEHDLFFVMACMTENKVRHLPVMKDGVLHGIVSIGDVVKQRIHSLEAESETLREYIAAREWRYHNQHSIGANDTATLTTVE